MSRDIIDKRNELNRNSLRLRSLKFDITLWNSRNDVTRLIKEQDDTYKKFIFYKEFIKAQNKEKRR